MGAYGLWSRILFTVGGIAMLVGAIDPVEGSLLILPGRAWSRSAPSLSEANAD